MSKHIILFLLFSMFSVIPVHVSANEQKASDFVERMRADILEVITNDALSKSQKTDKLEALFNQHVGTGWMSESVIGRYKHQADAESLKRFKALYHDYLRLTYVPRFKEYNGGGVSIDRVNKMAEDKYNVITTFVPTGNEPRVRIDYMLIKQNKDFKIVDIKAEGVSLLAKQSSDFGGLISRKGFDFFVNALEKKVKLLKKKA